MPDYILFKNKEIAFNNIQTKDRIVANVIDEGIKKTKNFMVVGKDDDYIYCVRVTPKNQKSNSNYITCNEMVDGFKFYYRYNMIFKIGKEDLVGKRSPMPNKTFYEILRTILRRHESYEHIDLTIINNHIRNGSILLKDNDLFIILNKVDDSRKCVVAPLIKTTENDEIAIRIKGNRYIVSYEDKEERIVDNSYIVLGYDNRLLKPPKKKKEILKPTFGDVLSLKNSNLHIIYLATIEDVIYYMTFDQLELFTGLNKIDKDRVDDFVRKLTDEEINLLIQKVEKPLISPNYSFYDGVKEEILDKIKGYKSNS